MAAPEILERSKREYDQLQQTIEADLPHFEGAFATVRNYHESLPWDLFDLGTGAAKRS
jgi:hypothetical protein